MSRRIFELDKQGVKALMKSEEMNQAMKSVADEAAERLGEGYEADTHTGKTRVNASVYAVTAAARRENLSENTILKAVFGR
jgi:hypothetical protein